MVRVLAFIDTLILDLKSVKFFQFKSIRGSILAKNGTEYKGYYLVDTGSSYNIINIDATKYLSINEEDYIDETINISGMSESGMESRKIKVNIGIDTLYTEEIFCISEEFNMTKYFGKNNIIGILGVQFLQKHSLVVDFQQKIINTSNCEEFDGNGKNFIFPMYLGLKHYGIPVVGFMKDEQEFVCIADSGSDTNIIAKYAMEKGATSYSDIAKGIGSASGIGCSVQTEILDISLPILSYDSSLEKILNVEETDTFNVVPGKEYLTDCGNKEIPPISCLLGTPFMLKRGWILDFKIGVIYTRKSA